jgi:hypothetical protein
MRDWYVVLQIAGCYLLAHPATPLQVFDYSVLGKQGCEAEWTAPAEVFVIMLLMTNTDLIAAELRKNFHFDPEIGVFTRILASGGVKAGDIARPGSDGYVRIRLLGKTYKAHRLAWLWVHGCMPNGDIDHINGVKADNRITNLREASRAVNTANIFGPQVNNTSGHLGVTRYKLKWRAQISVNGKMKYIGLFATPEDAHRAYLAAKAIHHPSSFLVNH